MNKGHYYELIERFGDGREMAEEGLILDVSQQLFEVMEEAGVTKAELAKRLDCSKAYVTKLLRGPSNMTLRKVAEVFFALGRVLKLKAVPADEETDWECVKTKSVNHQRDAKAPSRVSASPVGEPSRRPRKRAVSAAKKSG
ncbi:MAG TPA: XRE family transcriptional regulator [Candidatus Coatesbacteria bacterium]|nr:XRE family transcriptional regulator [Candidatus Coatesbacteria bacterium]